MSTEIEWKSDWRPSELDRYSCWWVRKHDGQLGIIEVDYGQAWIHGCDMGFDDSDVAASEVDLGPPCRIGDAAEVQRLRKGIDGLRLLADGAMDLERAGVIEDHAALPARDVRNICAELLSPERQEAGDGE